MGTRARNPRTPPNAGPRRLSLETLEDRRMLATFSVSNLDDAGAGSFRQAIVDANNSAGTDDIVFNSGLFTTPQTLALDSALPTITGGVSITGPGPALLTIDAGDGSDNLAATGDGFRLLDIDDNDSGNMINVSVEGMTLTGGDVTGKGGAISNRENLTLTEVAVVDNATGPGTVGVSGGVGLDGSSGGRGGDGGGIFSSGGTLTIERSTVSGNSTGAGGNGGSGGDGANGTAGENGGDGGNGGSGGYGGGVFIDGGSLTITDSTISGNSTGAGGLSGAAGDGGDGTTAGSGGRGGDGGYGGNGGGFYSSIGSVTISNSTISGNSTGVGRNGANGGAIGDGTGGQAGEGGDGGNGGSGGGFYSVEGQLQLSTSTVTGNAANASGAGGTGSVFGSAGIPGKGGGFDSLGNDPVLIDNSIIAENSAAGIAPDLRTGSVTTHVDFTLIGNADGFNITSGGNNQLGTAVSPLDPQLAPLSDNGGPTQTHAPLPASPALDAGDTNFASPPDFDQRGAPFARVHNGRIDIGALEVQPSLVPADLNNDGFVDGLDLGILLGSWEMSVSASQGELNGTPPVDGLDLGILLGAWNPPPALAASYSAPAAASTVDRLVVIDLALTNLSEPPSTGLIASTAILDPPAPAAAAPPLANDPPSEATAPSQGSPIETASIDAALQDEMLAIRL